MNNAKVSNVVRHRRGAAEIAGVVARYRASGLTQERFCRNEGIGLSTLSCYLRRERQGAQGAGAFGVPALARFLEVEIEAEGCKGFVAPGPEGVASGECACEAKGAGNLSYRIEFGGALRVEVPGGFDAGELERLIAIILEAAAR